MDVELVRPVINLPRIRANLVPLLWLLLGPGATVPSLAAESRPLFVDRAAETGLDFVHFNGMSGELYFSEMMGSGVALLDYDDDGDLDVYLVQGHMLGDKPASSSTFPPRHPQPLTDRLYRNDLAVDDEGHLVARFVDVTDTSRVESHGYGMGVTVGDIDNDGDSDLYVTNAGANQMLRNEGDGTFRDVTRETGAGDRGWGVSAAFADLDRDGWIDLYVGNYVDYNLATDKECISQTGVVDYCGPLAYQAEPDRMYRNRGDGTFEDVSVRAGISSEKAGNTLGVVSGDFNADGWLDLYVANDQVPNALWLNQHDGTFRNEALLSGSAVNEEGLPEASMGVVAGDLDGNGFEDLFMSHLTQETNTLYLNDGTGMFRDASRDSGLGMPSWASTGFGVALLDFDLDGWLDLFVANGAVKIIEELARQGDPYPLHQINQLFRNLGGGRFVEVTAEAGDVFELSEVSRGVASGDVDNDGDPDIVVSNSAGPARLLVNQTVARDRWLGLRLVGGVGGPTTLGTRVVVLRSDGSLLWRRSVGDGSYASANDTRVLFGLAQGPAPVGIRVLWPRGRIQELREPPVGRFLSLQASPERLKS